MKERAARIQKLVVESGKSYQELEKITGIKKSSLQRYASGITGKIPLTAIEKLSAAFSVPVSFLMWGEEKEKPTDKVDELSPTKKALVARVMMMDSADLEKLEKMLDLLESK